jgi:hypothetical protein
MLEMHREEVLWEDERLAEEKVKGICEEGVCLKDEN